LYFNEKETFKGLITTALKLMEIRKHFVPEKKLFDDRKFFLNITFIPDTNSVISFNLKGANEILEDLSKAPLTNEDTLRLSTMKEINRMLKKENNKGCFSKELFLNCITNAQNRSPLFIIYKIINPQSFFNLGHIWVHNYNYSGVIKTIERENFSIKEYILSLLYQYFPPGLTFSASFNFLFGRHNCEWKTESDNFIISLDNFGDDYEQLARLMTRELYYSGKKDLQIDVYPFLFEGKDTLIFNLMTEVCDGGLSNYIAPVLQENRPAVLLERDFYHFKKTVSSILENKNRKQIDSLINTGLDRRFLFYTMGRQMCYSMDKVLGRASLKDALILGPVYFFRSYIDAYELDNKIIRDVFQFYSDFEKKVAEMNEKNPSDIFSEMIALKLLLPDSTKLPGKIEKLSRKYADRKDSYIFNLLSAQLLYERGFYDLSALYFTKAFPYLPDKDRSAKIMGYRYHSAGANDLALHLFDKFVEVSPWSIDARMTRGKLLFEMKNYDKAMVDFEIALKKDPKSDKAKEYIQEIKKIKGL
ncbi:hypothetical protein D4R20_01945, partial [bacterium]